MFKRTLTLLSSAPLMCPIRMIVLSSARNYWLLPCQIQIDCTLMHLMILITKLMSIIQYVQVN